MFGLLLDRDDSVWVATAAGVAHLVGDRVTVYGTAAGLPDAPVFRLVQTGDGQLYVGTERGAFRREGERFVPLSAQLPARRRAQPRARCQRAMWVGSVNHGLMRLAQRRRSNSSAASMACRTTVSPRCSSIARAASGPAPTPACCACATRRSRTYNSEHGLSDDYVRALVQGRDGSIWIGTSRGLNRWQDGKLVDRLHERRWLAGRFDPEPARRTADGSLWAGTYVGGPDAVARRQGCRALRHRRWHARQQPDPRARAGARRQRCGSARRAGWCDRRTASSACSARPRDCRAISSSACTSRAMARSGSVPRTAPRAWSTSAIVPIDLHAMNDAQDVFDFHEDGDGTMWIATDRGLVRYRNGSMHGARAWRRACRSTPCSRWSTTRPGSFWLTSNRGVMRVARRDAEAVLAASSAR